MTERKKMLAGEWYDANFDAGLIAARQKTEELCFDFNNARPGSAERKAALEKLLGCAVPGNIEILPPVYFDYGVHTQIGEYTFINRGCYFMDGGGIIIGSHVFIGPFCGFYTANHPLEYAARNRGLEKASPIVIGDNCWLGANVSVMPGVTIGRGCVIAAGSVVTHDVPDNSMAAGVPAVVKKRIEP